MAESREAIGYIAPERVYSTEGVYQAVGLARESLRDARASGIVKPVKKGKQLYYLGSQLIEWILSGDSK